MSDRAESPASAASLSYRVLLGLLLLILALPPIFVALAIYFRSSPEYRFPFPATRALTEVEAIELSKHALLLDGKQTDAMRAVPSGHTGSDGREIFYLRSNTGSDEGVVLWWLGRAGYDWEYELRVARRGEEVICTVVKPL